MRIVTFNVNSIRKRLESGQIQRLVRKDNPDIIGLQEIKVTDAEFPRHSIEELGYDVIFFGQPTHYGVALMARHEMRDGYKGFPNSNVQEQRRLVGANFPLKDGRELFIINGYFPQGENRAHPRKFPYKKWFYARLMEHLKAQYSPDAYVCLIGDMNVAPEDADVGLGAESVKRWLQQGKCAFLPEEREMLRTLMDWGFEDSYRLCHPSDGDTFSWFDYRSRGFERDPKRGLRIDLILSTKSLQKRCRGAGIDYDIRAMQTPSDHAPVWAEFDI